jgi:hypothetical protein
MVQTDAILSITPVVYYMEEDDKVLSHEQTSTDSVERLTALSSSVLGELKLGKQSRDYKLVSKALRRLIELATTSTPSPK